MKRLSINRVQQYKSDVAFKTLVDGVNDNLYFIPKYQRNFRWKKKQVQELVRSLVNGYPIPPIYAYRNSHGQLEILDGQQRVMSLFFYYIGRFMKKESSVDFRRIEIDGKKYEEVLNDVYNLEPMKTILNPEAEPEEQIDITYATLPIDIKRQLDYTNITVIELRWNDLNERAVDIQSIFRNLNSNGTLLTEQEVRNGVYDCEFYDMLRDLNINHKGWRNIWGNISPVEEDMEFLLRLCTVKRYVSFNKGEFEIKEYSAKYSVWMDIFSEEAAKMEEYEIKDYREALVNFFEKFHLNKVVGSQKALLESLFVVYEKCRIKSSMTQEIIDKIKEDQKFKDSTRQGTVKRNTMNERWKAVYEIMAEWDRKGCEAIRRE